MVSTTGGEIHDPNENHHYYRQDSAPTSIAAGGGDPLQVGDIWSDTSGNLLKRCTGVNPDTFTSVEGGGSGSMTTVKAVGTQLGGADIVTLDFADEFDLTEDPDTEVNITIRDSTASAKGLATAAQITKLDAIEASADVTDAGNVDALAIAAVEGELTLVLAGDVTIDGAKTLKVDVIDEKDAAAGVTIEAVLLKDGEVAVGAVAFDDATSDPLIDADAAADGSEDSIARKDHVHIKHHAKYTDSDAVTAVHSKNGGFSFIIDGGGSTITTGIKGDVEIPFAGTITAVRLFADQSGAIVVDIWKDSFANFPPTDADSITASAVPTITASGVKSEDATLTGWTTAITKGDILRFNVDSVTSIERLTLSLSIDKT